MKYLILIIMSAVTLSLVSFGYFVLSPVGHVSEKITFEVKSGEPLGAVAHRLGSQNLISSVKKFKLLALISGYSTKVKTGEYELNRGMSPMQVLRVLASGKSIVYSITFPEGMNIYEMSELIAEKGLGTKQEFLDLAHDKSFIYSQLQENLYSLEGYLFPETYNYSKHDTVKTVVSLMIKRFLEVYTSIEHMKNKKFTRKQWVILASIIEKETGYKKERRTISSVFHNRLRKDMRLQTDPTVLYGILEETKKIKNNITKKDLRTKNRYNTYTFKGLPFGPISNPGKEALIAAMQPEQTSYLYFVSRNNGTSHFSNTLKEHNQAVREFQLDQKAREGKSWRDLHRKKNTQ